MYKITTKKGKIISWISTCEFCMWSKAIKKNQNNYIIFDKKEKAINYINNTLTELNIWINEDIPKQSKNWGDKKDIFIQDNIMKYNRIKKAINNLIIEEE